MANKITVIPVPYASTRSGLRKLALDGLLSDDTTGAIRFLFDMGDALSYVNQADPVAHQAVVKDLSGHGDGQVQSSVPSVIAFQGGGMDFTNVASAGPRLQIPQAVAVDLWNPVNGLSQNFLVCIYVKLATLANWNQQVSPQYIFGGGGSYASNATFVDFMLVASGSTIRAYRQYAPGSVDQFACTPQSADYGGFAQFAYWRSPLGQWARLRTPNGVTWSASNANGAAFARGTDNTQDFSAANFNPYFGWAFNGTTTKPNGLTGLRIYRGWIDNLSRDNRDPVSLLDRDYVATVARGVYS